ncbi:SDR family NAD(P)-dependent oxidoreductase [Oricola cellulosilytica]|uniref:SDR family NAD(P)-dependent oxidoreductase n=1 Tax=Oricola cellulosilytica TaxID=1429082 RepID=A0A4R0PFL7_9HYPH|nr:SDR family NAD(P)-dependent oxidoreductase [Oricola cellulosilytica]TCD16637.1 SDR family NAD(P)-dependent oxidoreductase [Oricola cellulosilytica]
MAVRRKILVTGATDGIGLALVRRLASRHDVLATGRRPSGEPEQLLPGGVLYTVADQSEPEVAARSVARALLKNNWSRLDYAILNAGVAYAAGPGQETAAAIRQTLDVNLLTTIALAHTLFPYLEKAGGQLTLIGSVSRKCEPDFASYAASKTAMHEFARALREEWRGRVRVQMLHPGPTMTGMYEKAGFDPGWTRHWFIRTGDMAAMMEAAIRAGGSPKTLSFLQYFSGASVLGRTIR